MFLASPHRSVWASPAQPSVAQGRPGHAALSRLSAQPSAAKTLQIRFALRFQGPESLGNQTDEDSPSIAILSPGHCLEP